ncbi:MAG: hypothetical protein ACRDHW_20090 [Ktedonobacteraceae bacterium]
MRTNNARRGPTVEGSLSGSRAQSHLHWEGLHTMTPLALLAMLIVLAVVVWIFTLLQITGTENAVNGLLQLTTAPVQTSAIAGQPGAYLSGQATTNQTIAGAIGWGIQVVLLTLTLSPDGALVLIHLKHSDVPGQYITRQAVFLGKLRGLLLILLIGADVLTDFLYAIQGHTLFVWNDWHPDLPSTAAAGTLLVGLLYPAVLIFVNVFGVKYLFAIVAALAHKLRGMTNAQ